MPATLNNHYIMAVTGSYLLTFSYARRSGALTLSSTSSLAINTDLPYLVVLVQITGTQAITSPTTLLTNVNYFYVVTPTSG